MRRRGAARTRSIWVGKDKGGNFIMKGILEIVQVDKEAEPSFEVWLRRTILAPAPAAGPERPKKSGGAMRLALDPRTEH